MAAELQAEQRPEEAEEWKRGRWNEKGKHKMAGSSESQGSRKERGSEFGEGEMQLKGLCVILSFL